MLRALLRLVRPFHAIASELRIIRELYELELAERQPPIIRITEKPTKKDFEVSYAGVEDKAPRHKRWRGVDLVVDGSDSEEEGGDA